MEKMDGMSMDLNQENIEKLKELFPNAVTEGKIDFDVLRSMLGEEVDDSKEKYQFTWKGKAESIKLAQTPSTATLRPYKEKSKNWDTTENLYIEGDNLEVLKQLQKTYFGKIKMIYIDPPYNTGNDFIYKDNFKDSVEKYKEQTNQMQKSNPETSGRYHSDWLNLMYPRLIIARNLLKDDGIVFISIDDNEVANLKKLCDEVFGETNFVAIINWKGRGGRQDSKYYAAVHEYILCYAKSKSNYVAGEEIKTGDVYPKYDTKKGRFYKNQLLRKWGSNSRRADRPNLYYPIIAPDGSEVFPVVIEKDRSNPSIVTKHDGCWRHGPETMTKNIKEGKVEFIKQDDGSWIAYEKIFAPLEGEEKTKKYTTWIDETNDGASVVKDLFSTNVFDYPKTPSLVIHFLKMADVSDDDIVIDFFSGSATTAHAVMQTNKDDCDKIKFIMVQLPESTKEGTEAYLAGYKTICDIGEERIRRAGEKIKQEWIEKKEEEGMLSGAPDEFPVDIGFKVFKLDSTNINSWDNTSEYDEKTLMDTATVFKLDRSKEDVLYEVMLKYGVFDQPASEVEINGKTMYRVGQRHMIVCLEDKIDDNDIIEICKLEPRVVVFKEDGFKDDNAKINAEYNLKKAGVEDVKCI